MGQAMCYCDLPSSRTPIARTTIQAITKDELSTDAVKKLIQDYDSEIAIKLREFDDSAPPQGASHLCRGRS